MNETYNPFDTGIQKAIEQARKSIRPTTDQKHRAINSAFLTFANKYSSMPAEKGFLNNIGAIGDAGIPAMQKYHEVDANNEVENLALADNILKHQLKKEQEEAKKIAMERKRQLEEAKLEEQIRHHNVVENQHAQQNEPSSFLGEDFLPITSKAERTMYVKDKKSTGEILHELNTIKKDYDLYRQTVKNDRIDPQSTIGTLLQNKYYNNITRNSPSTILRQALDARLNKFAAELERKIKGGVLSMGMIKLFEDKSILPNLKDSDELFKLKMANLMGEIKEKNEASDASLRYNSHVSPYELERLKTITGENNKNSGLQEVTKDDRGYILLKNPKNNTQIEVPSDIDKEDLQQLILNGYAIDGQ